ncbi:MAG: hypothetical protein HUU50_13040 [Candidatus Brocadiae bacterium]|nr:hypothetical protein [Candidatus Brocadiia bacterium]
MILISKKNILVSSIFATLFLMPYFFSPMAEEIKKETKIELRGITVLTQERKIEVKGIVNMTSGLVELLATSPGGKEHESILVLECNPALLQTSLLLIGLNPGGGGKFQGDTIEPYGDKVFLYISWKEKDSIKRLRAEELVWDKKYERPMPPTAWIFTGSRFEKTPKGKSIFKANLQGVIAATYHDPDAILNNPLPERTDDSVYYANEKTLPPKGTNITMILSAVPLEKE